MSEIKNLVDQMRSKIKESEVPGAAGKAKKDKTVPLKEVSPKVTRRLSCQTSCRRSVTMITRTTKAWYTPF